jgi:type I restriction enzyme S subunit
MSETLLKHFDLMATAPDGVAKLRELILTLAVQGKLVPQDPIDEPASVLLQRIRAEKDRLIAEGKIKRDKPLPPITDEEKPFELPVWWEWAGGGSLFDVIRGVTYQKTDAREAPVNGHIALLRANNIRATINFDDLVYVPETLISSDQLLQSGDYVVCLASGSKHLVGKAAAFPDDLQCSFGAFYGAIRPWQSLDYLSVYLASPLYRGEVSAASAGIGINNLKGSTLVGLCIPVPPLAEQSRIVTRVEKLMRLCDALEAKQQLVATQHAQLLHTLLSTLTDSATPDELAAHWQRVATHFDLLLDRPEAVDALEQTILQLAVRGLLVPQDPRDEPASVLLQRIRAEKDRLIAEGKIKRDKPLPPITDEEKPFELPQGWEWATMDGLSSQITDGAHHTPTYVAEGVPFLTVKDLSSGFIDFSDTRFLNP